MTIVLVLDTEQAALIGAANAMMHAAMDARASRIDPEGTVSKAAQMSRAKCATVEAQLQLGPLLEWDKLAVNRKLEIRKIAKALIDAETEQEEFIIYSGLRALVLSRDLDARLPWHTPDHEEADIRGSALEEHSGPHEADQREMQPKVRKKSRRSPPSDSAQ